MQLVYQRDVFKTGENEINEDKVKDLVGIPNSKFIQKIVDNIIHYNPTDALLTISEVLNDGKDLDNFLWEIIKYLKDILLYKTCGSLPLYNENELEQIKSILEDVSKDRLLSLIYELSELANSIKWSTQKQIVFEAGIIKVCTNVTGLEDRIKALEDKLENENVSGQTGRLKPPDSHQSETKKIDGGSPKDASPTDNKIKPVKSDGTTRTSFPTTQKSGNNVSYWADVVNNLKKNGKIVLYTNLINTNAIEINDLTLGIEFPNGLTAFGKTVIEQPENMQEIVKQVSILAGKEMRIKLIDSKANATKEDTNIDNGLTSLGIDINVIDNQNKRVDVSIDPYKNKYRYIKKGGQ